MRNNMYIITVELEDDVTEKNAKELLELIRKIPEVAMATIMGDDEED